jgi:predicted aminopeptidase
MLNSRALVRCGRTLLLLVTLAALGGCALPFYWQAIGGQFELLRKRTPIQDLLADPEVDGKLKTTLAGVADIRKFAVTELHLPDNASYTTYVALDRPYVVWNVVAAEEFSVDPKRWCFPFVGCVGYRGFFSRDAAERFAGRLVADGLDTYSGGSGAYSTLGYFADPVLSTMIGGGQEYVASVLFHELAHQQLYIKNDSEFSEAFATTIEEYGTDLWLREHAGVDAVDAYHRRLRYRADFADLVSAQQLRLRTIYARVEPIEAKRADKAAAFEAMRGDYAEMKKRWGGITDYDAWFAQPLNNATLAAVATYRRWVPALRAHLDTVGIDAFFADAESLAKLSATARAIRLQSWLQPEATTSLSSVR